MAYVEWHDTVRNHFKTDALMLDLKISRREAVGIIGCLSSWAIQFRPGGLIERKLIAVAVEWEHDADKLVNALLAAGWLDRKGNKVAIHDWKEITRGYRKARKDAARRARDKRGSGATDALPERDDSAATAPLQPRSDPIRSEQNGTEQRGEEGEVDSPAPKSGTTEAIIADEYLRWNKGIGIGRAWIIQNLTWRIRSAGMNPKTAHERATKQEICEGNPPWVVFDPVTPNGKQVPESMAEKRRRWESEKEKKRASS